MRMLQRNDIHTRNRLHNNTHINQLSGVGSIIQEQLHTLSMVSCHCQRQCSGSICGGCRHVHAPLDEGNSFIPHVKLHCSHQQLNTILNGITINIRLIRIQTHISLTSFMVLGSADPVAAAFTSACKRANNS